MRQNMRGENSWLSAARMTGLALKAATQAWHSKRSKRKLELEGVEEVEEVEEEEEEETGLGCQQRDRRQVGGERGLE
eukprot:235121-Pleurochrysis_carterae.AAC.1